MPISKQSWECIEEAIELLEPDLERAEMDPDLEFPSDTIDWEEIEKFSGKTVLDFAINEPFIDKNNVRHHFLALNSFSTSSAETVIAAIDAIMPPCMTVQAPRDARMSQQLSEQLKYIDKNSTGLDFKDELLRIAKDRPLEDLQEEQLMSECMDYPLDELLTRRGILANTDWVTAAWASRQLGSDLVFTHIPLTSFLVWRNFFDKHGQPCEPPNSGASDIAFNLVYAPQLGQLKYESHFEAARTIINAMEPPSLAYGNLIAQLEQMLDPSLHMLQVEAPAHYTAGMIADHAKSYSGKSMLHIVRIGSLWEILGAMKHVTYLPNEYQKMMQSNGSGSFWRSWQELGGTQTEFISLDTFTRPEEPKTRQQTPENPIRGFQGAEPSKQQQGVALDE